MISLAPLSQTLHQQTDELFILRRLGRSWKQVTLKSPLLGVSTAISTIFSSIYGLFFSACCIEGAVRSYWDVSLADSYELRELGDAGGWTALAIFTTLAMGTIGMQLIREGEYSKVRHLCRQWFQENPGPYEGVYGKMSELIRSYGSLCFFGKSVIGRQIHVIKIVNGHEAPLSKKHRLDLELLPTLKKIHTKIQKKTGPKRIFHRLNEGRKTLQNQSCSKQFGAYILGIALPIILISCAILSFIGEVYLGIEVWKEQHDTTAVGHLGEWPLNGAEALGAAFYLLFMCLICEGDFSLSRKILSNHLKHLQEDPTKQEQHRRLSQLANEELARQAANCQYAKSPLDYEFA